MPWTFLTATMLALASLVIVSAEAEQKPITLGGSPTGKNPFTEDFGKFVEEIIEHHKVPGLAIAVIDGENTYAEAYGYATLPDTKATPETLWYAGSTTKAFTAATIAHLIGSTNYSVLASGWSTPISSIIRDDFVLQDEWATNHLTLDDLVSHRSGMPRHDLASVSEIDGRQATSKDTARNLRNFPLFYSPRTGFHYCNIMFVTLSYAIEVLTSMSLKVVFQHMIWGPLGMNSTYLSTEDAENGPEHLSTGYYWDDTAENYVATPRWLVHGISGAGATISNVLDYAKWIRCLIDESAPFSLHTHADIKRPRMIDTETARRNGETQLYGLGWVRTTIDGNVVYTHSGGTMSHGAFIFWLPAVKYGVVAFGNTAVTSNIAEDVIIRRLIDGRLNIKSSRTDFGVHRFGACNNVDKKQSIDDLIEGLYPERPQPSLPSSLNTTQLQGKYFHLGFGELDLREKLQSKEDGRRILVARRLDTMMKYELSLYHASGDYWAARVLSIDNPTLMDMVIKAKFLIGSNGKATELETVWEEGPIVFKRMD